MLVVPLPARALRALLLLLLTPIPDGTVQCAKRMGNVSVLSWRKLWRSSKCPT